MSLFIDAEAISEPRDREDVCGDTYRIVRTQERYLALLSDGLGSGVQASVSSTLTVEILSRMITAHIPLEECVQAVAATLPPQRPSNAAYATFLVIDIDRLTGRCVVSNYGNPDVLYFSRKSRVLLPPVVVSIAGKEIHQQTFHLQHDDLIVAMSDGIPGAGRDTAIDESWSISRISKHIQKVLLLRGASAAHLSQSINAETVRAYGGILRDDATHIVIHARQAKQAVVFTGPPVDPSQDDELARQFMGHEGRKIVCGGTTGTIVSIHLGSMPRLIAESAAEDLPPISRIEGVDLATEGLLTLSRATEYLAASKADTARIPDQRSGAGLLARELLIADSITFMVGLADNAAYSQLHLPSSSLFRRSVIRQMDEILRGYGKEVRIAFC